MRRAILAVLCCASALVVGVSTACLAAKNRARAAELDRRQHVCETYARQNELLRAVNDEDEWRLLQGEVAQKTEENEDLAGERARGREPELEF
jgi:hypothetical protein